MSTIVGIGATQELEGFALAGVRVIPAATGAEVATAWSALDSDVGLVIVSPAAAQVLQTDKPDRPDVLVVVMP
jgi:vacuolar-type H+-ATPase subunit F/Vma7